jgi:3',5'-cyclic-AMP phosphodiesterase
MRIAHLSDLHLCSRFKRENISKTSKLIRYALNNGAEHFVVTGDISDNANSTDFNAFRNILKKFGLFSSDKTTIVVGNHDIFGGPQAAADLIKFPRKCINTDYNRKVYNFVNHFKELFENTYRQTDEVFFPFVKVLDKVVLIGLNTIDFYSRLKNPFASNGHVSKIQRKHFSQLLFNSDFKDKVKVVLAHHHFYKSNESAQSSEESLWGRIENYTMKLRGKKKLIKLFLENNIKLVMHGHSHEMREYERDEITFLNAGGSVDNNTNSDASLFLVDLYPAAIQSELCFIKTKEPGTSGAIRGLATIELSPKTMAL